MHRRKKAVLTGVAVLSAIGLALPATGAAATRSYTPLLGVQNTSMIVVIDTTSSTDATGTVSWGDVSWGDALIVE
jgi:hypothetical protein